MGKVSVNVEVRAIEFRAMVEMELRGEDLAVIPETVVSSLIPIFVVTGFTGFPDVIKESLKGNS